LLKGNWAGEGGRGEIRKAKAIFYAPH